MPIEVDPAFQRTGERARARHKQRLTVRIVGVVGLLSFVGLIVLLVVMLRSGPPPQDGSDLAETGEGGDEDFVLVQADEGATPEVSTRFARVLPANIQVAPMILRLASNDENIVYLAGPQDFEPERLGGPGTERIAALKQPLVAAEQRLELVLPSSRDDFALFQAGTWG